ncbi:hypothetical protein F5Y15DRAFT_378331 [Xylariaceae sp. FL0016]|nr:hypothetical protein F5Y15DRAFT_378331 [Xylariaceae sp. FL0016]
MSEHDESIGAEISTERLDKAINTLENEMDSILKSHGGQLPGSIQRRLYLIRDLGLQSKDDSERSTGVPRTTPLMKISRNSMNEYCEWSNSMQTETPLIQACYRTATVLHRSSKDGGRLMDQETEIPLRVVINRSTLLSELSNISGIPLTVHPMIFAKPYKFLLSNYSKINQRLVQLQESLSNLYQRASTTENTTKDLEVPESERPSFEDRYSHLSQPQQNEHPPSETASKIAHHIDLVSQLGLLMDFINTDLEPYLLLEAKIADRTLEEISFEDLWYLFRVGESLYVDAKGRDQLSIVYGTTGAQERKRDPTAAEESRIETSLVPIDMQQGQYRTGHATRRILAQSTQIGSWTPFVIDSFVYEFDGKDVGPVGVRNTIDYYQGRRKITDLPVYPLAFHENQNTIVSDSEARGRALLDSHGHKNHKGTINIGLATLEEPPRLPWELFRKKPDRRKELMYQEFTGDIYVDIPEYCARTAKPSMGVLELSHREQSEVQERVQWGMKAALMQFNPRENYEETIILIDHEVDEKKIEDYVSSNRSKLTIVDKNEAVASQHHLQHLKRQLPAYIFRWRKYAYVDISNVSPIPTTPKTGFEDLVISKEHKSLLLALVGNHAKHQGEDVRLDQLESTTSPIEIVRGKGRGLIILFHGPPGSGKTSTAETVAAYTSRPLYAITCGDLGINPEEVEGNLKQHCERASNWGCILLLDEAEVFLTRRDWHDVNRNALVSVFLRELEYYSGILFLTTNRVGVIDEAFKSRIHVTLRYPRIELDETRRIRENTLRRIDRDNQTSKVKIRFNQDDLLDFAKRHYLKHEESKTTWNGRQIRNAFQTAIVLGQHDREKELRENNMTPEDAEKSGRKKFMTVKLTVKNFKSIAKIANEFEDYLNHVRGFDADSAYLDQWRDDRYDPRATQARKTYEKTYTPRRPHARDDHLSPQPSGTGYGRKGKGRAAPMKQPSESEDSDEDDIVDDDDFSDEEE